MQNIILNIGKDYLKGNPQVFLKVNSIFKKMGFEEVNTGGSLNENNFCEKMTLYITPSVDYKFLKEVNIKDKFPNKAGNSNQTYMNEIYNYDDEIDSLIINDVHIGDYYKDRNFVIFFYSLLNTNLDLGIKNDFLFYLLEELGNEIERIKPKVVNVSVKMREELINKFLEGIKNTMSNLKSNIRDNLQIINDYRNKELSKLSEIKQQEEQIKVLSGSYKQIGNNIEAKMQEIKKLKFVKRVGISNLGIRVDFKHIDLDVNGKKVELGECYTYLNPNRLEIKNKNYVVYKGTTFHSPHIEYDTICFGSGKDKAFELLSGMKFKELVYFIYLYLKTYNEDDTYLSIEKWIKCKNNGGVWDSDEDDEDGEYNEDN